MRKVRCYCFKCDDVLKQTVVKERKVSGLFEDHTELVCECPQCQCHNSILEVFDGKDDVLL